MTSGTIGDPRRSIFVGRERELARLTAAFDGAIAGQGTVVAVTGEPGIGKTRLVQELERHANAKGIEVHWGRTPETEAAPYWPWLRAIRSLTTAIDTEQLQPVLRIHADALLRLFPELSPDGSGLASAAPAGGGDQLRVFDGITSLLVAAARLRPVILVLEDLHWADTASLALLRYLAPEIERTGLLLIVTYRSEELRRQAGLGETVASLMRHAHVQTIALAGLSQAEVEAYLREATGQEPAPQLVSRLRERTEGNPFFLSAVAPLQDGAIETALPPALKSALEQRLARLSRDCNDVLTSAAVIGQTFGLDVLRALAPGDGDQLLDALDEALVAGILDETEQPGAYRFHHALIQEALLDRLPALRKARLHGQVGEALERIHGQDPERAADLAFHFRAAAAVEPGYAEPALRHAKRAAEHAEQQYAWDEAARLYGLCVDLVADGASGSGAEIDLLLSQGRCLLSAPNPMAAATPGYRAIELLRQQGDGRRVADALALLHLYVLPANVARELVGVALDSIGDDEPRLRAHVLLQAAQRGDRAARHAWLAEAAAIVRHHRFRDLEAQVAEVSAMTADLGESFERLEQAFALYDALGDHGSAARCLSSIAFTTGMVGRTTEFAPVAERIERYTGSVRHDGAMHMAFNARATLATGRGDLRYVAEDDGLVQYHSFYFWLARCAMMRYELDYARELVEHRQWPWEAYHGRYAVWAVLEAESGDIDLARKRWQQFLRIVETRAPLSKASVYLVAAEPALMPLLDEGVCRFLLGLSPQWRISLGPIDSVDHAKGLAAFTLGMVDEAEGHFRTGQQWGEREAFPIHEARNLRGLADVAEARGDIAEALAYLERAIPLFERFGANLYLRHAAAMRERLLAAGARRHYPAGLTEREVEVLRLLATGMTNHQIADALVISPYTVERHVSHIYRKADLANRVEAAAYAHRHGLIE